MTSSSPAQGEVKLDPFGKEVCVATRGLKLDPLCTDHRGGQTQTPWEGHVSGHRGGQTGTPVGGVILDPFGESKGVGTGGAKLDPMEGGSNWTLWRGGQTRTPWDCGHQVQSQGGPEGTLFVLTTGGVKLYLLGPT